MARKKNNTTLVREYIREQIVKQGLRPGDMLPCEGDIAAALEISKSCVREANRALESIGLIEIRHGIGSVLRPFNFDAMENVFDFGFVLEPGIVIDLYDLRRQMETSMMSRVVDGVTETELEACEDILAQWKQLGETEKPTYEIDRLFHETLYSVVDNRMLTSLCHIFWKSYRDLEENQKIRRESPRSLEAERKTIGDHQAILNAVKQRNTQLATRLMYEHFGKINKNGGVPF